MVPWHSWSDQKIYQKRWLLFRFWIRMESLRLSEWPSLSHTLTQSRWLSWRNSMTSIQRKWWNICFKIISYKITHISPNISFTKAYFYPLRLLNDLWVMFGGKRLRLYAELASKFCSKCKNKKRNLRCYGYLEYWATFRLSVSCVICLWLEFRKNLLCSYSRRWP